MSCFQRPAAAKCDGPYAAELCEACRKLEGKCLTGRPHATCKGPFSDQPCKFCQNVKGLRDPRVAKRLEAWMNGLGLDAVEMNQVYPASSPLKPAQIDQAQTKKKLSGVARWVQIGNLYASVTTTGDGSWLPVFEERYRDGVRNFHIFSGRHGEVQGTVTKGGKGLDARSYAPEITTDKNHIEQDIKKITSIRAEYNDTRISLWDVASTDGSSVSKTRRLARECLSERGTVVILAWCYSLLSFDTITVEEWRKVLEDGAHYADVPDYNKPIKDIINQHYAWALLSHPQGQQKPPRNEAAYRSWKEAAPRPVS
jgi:hypothetical protein